MSDGLDKLKQVAQNAALDELWLRLGDTRVVQLGEVTMTSVNYSQVVQLVDRIRKARVPAGPRAPQDAPDVGSPWSDALNAKHARGESLTHDEQGEVLEAYRTLLVAYHSTAALGVPSACVHPANHRRLLARLLGRSDRRAHRAAPRHGGARSESRPVHVPSSASGVRRAPEPLSPGNAFDGTPTFSGGPASHRGIRPGEITMSLLDDFRDDIEIRDGRARVANRGKEKFAQKLVRRVAASHPSLSRGEVWCTKCGRHEYVNPTTCLRSGWPKCCGFTMTIDSPDERRAWVERGGAP